MVWGISSNLAAGYYNPYQYTASPVRASELNPWSKYFASYSQSGTNDDIKPYDAIAQLNELQNQQKTDETKSKKTNNTAETKRKEKAKKKLAKFSQNMQKDNSMSITKKHANAMTMILRNPQLTHLVSAIEGKIVAKTMQEVYLIQKAEVSQQQDLTADELENLVSSLQQKLSQLKNDWKKISSGIMKAGAYSEAMMRVDNDDKKSEYAQLAENVVAGMPDAFKDKEDMKHVKEAQEELMNEAPQDDEILIAETSENADLQASTGEAPAAAITADSAATGDEVTETADAEETEGTDKAAEAEDAEDTENEDKADNNEVSKSNNNETSAEDDKEIEKIKKEVLAEMEKQKYTRRNNPFAGRDEEKIGMLPSILGIA